MTQTNEYMQESLKNQASASKDYFLSSDWVKEETDKVLEAGVFRESHSSWSAPIVVVPKGDGGKRLCRL